MASTPDFVAYVCEQASRLQGVSAKKMFGEYALYLNGKVIALICDNQVFLKPTAEGQRLLGLVTEAPPYPGAKLHYQVNEHLEDGEFLANLFMQTAAALPAPKPKVKRRG